MTKSGDRLISAAQEARAKAHDEEIIAKMVQDMARRTGRPESDFVVFTDTRDNFEAGK